MFVNKSVIIIDGVIFRNFTTIDEIRSIDPQSDILPGVVEQFRAWASNGYKIILTTGRFSSLRDLTHLQIQEAGLFYDELVMGLPRGERVIIDDIKPSAPNDKTASAINIPRDQKLDNVEIA